MSLGFFHADTPYSLNSRVCNMSWDNRASRTVHDSADKDGPDQSAELDPFEEVRSD